MTSRNHPNPEALYPVMTRKAVLLLARIEKGWTETTGLAVLEMRADGRDDLLEFWVYNGLAEVRERRSKLLIQTERATAEGIKFHREYRATRAGKFVVKGWREAGWIE